MANKRKMIKQRIAAGVSLKARLTKEQGEAATQAAIDILQTAFELGEDVELRGFGTFKVITRKGRNGRNPRTGEPVTIGAKKFVRFQLSETIKL